MPTIAESFIDRNSNVIQEMIGEKAIEQMVISDAMFGGNPIFDDTGLEVISKELGRDMRIKSRYYGALAGVIRGGNLSNHVHLYGDATTAMGANMFMQKPTQVAPDPRHGPSPLPIGLTSRLYSLETNIMLSEEQLNAEAMPANIKMHIMPLLNGFAKQLTMWACNSLYFNSESQYRLASLGPSTGDGAYTIDLVNFKITFYPVEKITHRFARGMPIDIFKNTTTRANKSDSTASRVRLFVDSVDDFENKVVIIADPTQLAEDGTAATFATWATTVNITTAAFVVYANTYNSGFAGMYNLRDWFKWGGATNPEKRLLGSNAVTDSAIDYIDVTEQPQFKSMHFAAVGSINERKFLSHMAAVARGFVRHGHEIDTVIASDGILLSIFDSYLLKEQYQRQFTAPAPAIRMGWQGDISFVYEGMEITATTSRFVETGVMFGVKRSNNWRIVTPPDGTGIQNMSLPGKKPTLPLKFSGKAMGHASDRIPLQIAQASGVVLPTGFCHMPGYMRMQFLPKDEGQIPGVVWEGCDEIRHYETA